MDTGVDQFKSWVALCEEEAERKCKRTRSQSRNRDQNAGENSSPNKHGPSHTTPEKKHSLPNNFASYANILKSTSPNKVDGGESKHCDKSSQSKSDVKREIQKDFLQDDISLSGHLDVFHMASPCKANKESKANVAETDGLDEEFPTIDEWPPRSSHKKGSTPSAKDSKQKDEQPKRCSMRLYKENCAGKSGEDGEAEDNGNEERLTKRRFPNRRTSKKLVLPDDILMPSPSKMIRQFGNVENSPASCKTPKNDGRKRQREALSSPASGGSRKSSQKIETDAATLTRRQKQIDYGKNTIGYERYVELVPKNERHKNHPQTPPRNVQYSRRAWDGLIKIWRRRLHFWDPPSEGGGDPALLEDDGDLSSCEYRSLCTNSIPSTPQQESKRRKGREENESNGEIAKDEVEGCRPLAVEDWLEMMEDEEEELEEDYKFD